MRLGGFSASSVGSRAIRSKEYLTCSERGSRSAVVDHFRLTSFTERLCSGMCPDDRADLSVWCGVGGVSFIGILFRVGGGGAGVIRGDY